MSAEQTEPTGEPLSGWAKVRERAPMIVRFGVGLLGIAGLVLGAVIAWRSSSATTLLIVSAILVVLALIGIQWDTVRASFRDITIELAKIAGRVDTAAAAQDVPAEVRQELESLRDEVKELATTSAQAATRAPIPILPRSGITGATGPAPGTTGRTTAAAAYAISQLFTTTATHKFERGSVRLSLKTPLNAEVFTCRVQTPSGVGFSLEVRRQPALFAVTAVNTVAALYPDEFPGSEPLSPGAYKVEWRSGRPVEPTPTISELATKLAFASTPPIATDSFSIPDIKA
jgi:hypothetical protein